MAEPFYLYTRRQGGNYYVQFRLEDGSLSNHKSTGTPNYNEARKIAIGVKIENPQIFKEFMESEEIQWDYAIAAGVLTREEVEYIKEEESAAEPAEG